MSASSKGILFALAAYVLWGLLPVYWKALGTVSALEILAHRMVWSFLFLVGLILVRREWGLIRRTLANGRVLMFPGVAACLLGVNWLTYIYGVNTDRIVETSLGYYINPLVNVLLGVVVLQERLRPVQWISVALASAAVVYLTYEHGGLPWIALVLAFTFGFYGLVKKKMTLGAVQGLTFETAALVPLALVYLAYRTGQGTGALGRVEPEVSVLLVMTGVVTALPLLLFARAARSVSLSTIGLLQYVAPTCGLFLGVFVYHEPFTRVRAIGFSLIWVALVLYWLENVLMLRRVRRRVSERSND